MSAKSMLLMPISSPTPIDSLIKYNKNELPKKCYFKKRERPYKIQAQIVYCQIQMALEVSEGLLSFVYLSCDRPSGLGRPHQEWHWLDSRDSGIWNSGGM